MRLVFPDVDTVNFGSNFSAAQLVTWNGVEIVLVPPSFNCTVPVSAIFEQFVGLNWKFPRVVVALTCWISKGIPSMLVGIESGVPGGLEVIVIAEVSGFSSILPLTSTQSHGGWLFVVFARSNGPAFAGTSNVRPNGAHPLPRPCSRRGRCRGR